MRMFLVMQQQVVENAEENPKTKMNVDSSIWAFQLLSVMSVEDSMKPVSPSYQIITKHKHFQISARLSGGSTSEEPAHVLPSEHSFIPHPVLSLITLAGAFYSFLSFTTI
ncbi:hypothetical protein ATANTOWER_005694 [Ataeniobius toweri]|uniref:Uncharacterized protein n=1 Tax=Ataeniobius toweri TaxID=208326 RepID=A0ABU7AW84_9TELE|nr:hypothetical protein [Ataeniobius toweri]